MFKEEIRLLIGYVLFWLVWLSLSDDGTEVTEALGEEWGDLDWTENEDEFIKL